MPALETQQSIHSSPYDTHEGNRVLPRAFITRRLQSFTGVFLVLFLIEHLLTNSQAALFIGEDGKGFIDAVNFIHSLPYLPVIELSLLAVPILIHGYWGVQYLFTSKFNYKSTDGATPSLPLPRNRAYIWQRITAVLLLFGIILHVAYMRFVHQPTIVGSGIKERYAVKIQHDPGLETVSQRLNLQLISQEKKNVLERRYKADTLSEEDAEVARAIGKATMSQSEVIAISTNFGTALLMVVRNAFQSIWLCILYSLFVIAASFHACNGLWTAMISWGVNLNEASRNRCRTFSNTILAILLFLGLVSIWGSYWINLKD